MKTLFILSTVGAGIIIIYLIWKFIIRPIRTQIFLHKQTKEMFDSEEYQKALDEALKEFEKTIKEFNEEDK